ncbi:MAG TPA: hypothetical protein VN668_12815 [Stellaceae bacterium]|nr:hypothetical protein [Stellaceae bacterium]
MRLSQTLLDTVEAALPQASETGLATRAVHDRVGGWNRTTIRHALRELIRQRRAAFSGRDRHRRYRRAAPGGAPQPAPQLEGPTATPPKPARSWADYATRGDGSVRAPDESAVAAAMRRLGLRYRDVDAAALLAEERMAGWFRRPRSNAELTRAVFGDPAPRQLAGRRTR